MRGGGCGGKSSLIAFDRESGDIKWEQKRPDVGFAHSTPVLTQIRGQMQMLVAASNALQGLDPATGKVLWKCAARGEIIFREVSHACGGSRRSDIAGDALRS